MAQPKGMKRSSQVAIADPEQIRGTIKDLANMRKDGLNRFKAKWAELYIRRFLRGEDPDTAELFQLRNELRLLWNHLNKIPRIPESMLDKYEAWKALPLEASLPELICNEWLQKSFHGLYISWNDRHREIRASAHSLQTVLALGCIEYADKMRYCQNPDCPAPYFIASRKDQLYCGDDCAAPAKRAAKLKWWNENRGTKAKAKDDQ